MTLNPSTPNAVTLNAAVLPLDLKKCFLANTIFTMALRKINMTDSEIDHIMNVLRKGTVTWEGRSKCLKRQRKKVFERIGKKGQKIYKFHWQCAACKVWFRNEKDLEVDHIIEIGGFSGDWHEMVLKMYCRQDNLRALCITCHLKKTMQYNSAATKYKRKK